MNNTSLSNQNVTTATATISTLLMIGATAKAVATIIGFFGSLVVVLIVFSNKSLRTPCFQLIGASAIGSLFTAAYYFIRSVDIFCVAVNYCSLQRSGLQCHFSTGFAGILGMPYHAMLTFAVGIDRSISLIFPIWYKNLSQRYAIGVIFACSVFVCSQEIVACATAPLYSTIKTCTALAHAVHPFFISLFAGLNLFYCCIIVVAYLAIWICFWYRKRAIGDETNSLSNSLMKQQKTMMPTVKLLMILYVVFGVIPEIVINISLSTGKSPAGDIIYEIGTFLKTCGTTVEFISLMARSSKFRLNFETLFRRKPNTITVGTSLATVSVAFRLPPVSGN